MLPKKSLTKEQAYQKLRHYCAYQDRCHSEVKNKAYLLGLRKAEVEELTSKLIEENCLNEERFAKAFAGGKFRIKQWGRIKIKTELKNKQISHYCIAAAMDEIDDRKYKANASQTGGKKMELYKRRRIQPICKNDKNQGHLLLKGYESTLIAIEIKSLAEKQKGAG
jgi:regulatory protein